MPYDGVLPVTSTGWHPVVASGWLVVAQGSSGKRCRSVS